jgi:hypothetical protein
MSLIDDIYSWFSAWADLVENNHARLADTGAEAFRSTPRSEALPGHGYAAKPIPGAAGADTGIGTVSPGGGEAAPESNRAREEQVGAVRARPARQNPPQPVSAVATGTNDKDFKP